MVADGGIGYLSLPDVLDGVNILYNKTNGGFQKHTRAAIARGVQNVARVKIKS